jgi:hypothetical protein
VRGAPEILQLVSAGIVPCAAYLALGLRLLTRLGVETRGAERLALAFVFGSGVASLGILLLRALGVPLPLLAAGAVALLALPRPGRRGARSTGAALPADPGWVRVVDAATLALGALLFLAALGPETFWDGFEYHLPLVAAWTEGPIRPLPGFLDAEFRAGVDLLAVPALTSGFPDAAAAVSAAFALSLAGLVRAEARRRASPAAGSLAGLFTLLAPLSLELAPSTYVDLGLGAYGFAALLFADRWNRGGAPSCLTACTCCLAFAMNAKLHGAALAPLLLVIVLLGGRPPAASRLTRCAGLAALLVSPWLIKTTLSTGNPFFPLLGGWLGTGPTDATTLALRRLRLLANYPVPRDLGGLARYLASLQVGSNPHVGGLLGPLPLALAPLALGRLSRASAVLLATLCGLVVAMFFALPAVRFGTPVWPWLGVAAALGGRRLAASGALARGVLGAALVLALLHQGAAAARMCVERVAALPDPHAYERRVFPDQDALRRMVARAEPVVGIPMGAVAWMPRPVYNLLWERNGELFFGRGMPEGLVRTPPDRAFALLRARGVRSLVLDVVPPHPGDGRVGHPAVDVWLADGRARLAADVPSLPARGERVWVLVRLRDPAAP